MKRVGAAPSAMHEKENLTPNMIPSSIEPNTDGCQYQQMDVRAAKADLVRHLPDSYQLVLDHRYPLPLRPCSNYL